ncbi:MAG: hypothetical protein ACFFG0_13335 [Candidatus Thorarchaeota archaeon]
MRCIETCPTKAIYNTSIQRAHGRLTHIDVEQDAKGFLYYGCRICIKEYPFNKNPTEKMKKIAEKQCNSYLVLIFSKLNDLLRTIKLD